MCFFGRFLNTLNSSAELSGYSDCGRMSRHFPLDSRAGCIEIYLYLYIILSYIRTYIYMIVASIPWSPPGSRPGRIRQQSPLPLTLRPRHRLRLLRRSTLQDHIFMQTHNSYQFAASGLESRWRTFSRIDFACHELLKMAFS